MIITLFILNTIILFSTALGIVMYNNNLKKIGKSIDIYLDPKAYRPESEVRFISLLVDKYKKYEDKSMVELDSLISDYFYNNQIGKFTTSGIESLAKKGKGLLWISITTMVLFEAITVGLGNVIISSVLIIISAGLGVLLAFFEMYIDIDIKRKQLFLRIKNYLNNEYPQIKTNQETKKEVSLLLNKIDELVAQIEQDEDTKQEKNDHAEEDVLQEEDIVQILKHFEFTQT